MRRRLALVLGLLALVPAGAVGYQLAQVADAQGCPSALQPHSGPVRLRVVVERASQARALDAAALEAYLTDRAGRPFEVAEVRQGDETAFRLDAAARPFSGDVLVFLAHRAKFPAVPTAHGMVDALGFATPGTACAYVSFVPAPAPVLCKAGGAAFPAQPAFAYLAHEVGHLMGLTHSVEGLMGRGVFDLCGGDTFTPGQRAALQRWGA